ncbi:GIY-YIG nuclease family protein [Aureimonas psammosilenae]|uniref:GIY-YIG nuclease family protein n=1 Tax=Aureimonas psammosilenae TaxID=2495496 RepID=UPI001F3CE073|nr:GIY-YIG nuclease family protein [Aureimonas psammosilenae]
MSMLARSVRLFLVDGSAGGIMTAEVVNWTGHLLVAPRAKLAEVLNRPESSKTGVYFLFSELVEFGGRRPVYIGESDNVGRRILQHSKNAERDFERFCIVTSKDLNLTKAHARYLENRLTLLARNSGRAEALNAIEPAIGVLPESDVADMEYFIEQVRLVLPVLGYDVLKEPFIPPANLGAEVTTEAETHFDLVPLKLRPSRNGLLARAIERDGEVIVLKGSLAEANPNFTGTNQYQALRERLLTEKALVPSEDGAFLCFASDTVFSSPSAAAAVIYGRAANGRTSWDLVDRNMTLKEFQNQRVAAE